MSAERVYFAILAMTIMNNLARRVEPEGWLIYGVVFLAGCLITRFILGEG